MSDAMRNGGRAWPGLVLAGLLLFASAPGRADEGDAPNGVVPHPLELRALVDPEAVLEQVPGEIDKARAQHDNAEVARLYLAQANACRVIADWTCQRMAGAQAARAAQKAGQALLAVRGRIAESRGSIAMQDFTRGEQLLGQAELLLKDTPSPELSADVFLAYSSLSYMLGKHALA